MVRGKSAAPWLFGVTLLATLASLATTHAQGQKTQGAWTDPEDKALPLDFKLQGEYAGEIKGGGKLGAQVIALGNGGFQAVLYPGGLPGAGWDGKNKMLMDGKRDGDKATFTPPKGKRTYNAKKAEDFTATSKFPPPGHDDCTGTIADGVLTGTMKDGKAFALKKTIRVSPTFGLKPPPSALVLFDGTNIDAFNRGRLDKERGILHTDAKDVITKRKFMNYSLHVDFMISFKPDARGQQRGNSGLYMVQLYEVQILDSFGLDGKNNECGAIYSKSPPRLNMCFPPLQWQTFDIDFTSAVADADGKKVKNARITVKHNGVLIHDDFEIPGKTGVNARKEPEGTPGMLVLQGHANPTQFRNIWMVEKK